jgi:hypothetical protein
MKKIFVLILSIAAANLLTTQAQSLGTNSSGAVNSNNGNSGTNKINNSSGSNSSGSGPNGTLGTTTSERQAQHGNNHYTAGASEGVSSAGRSGSNSNSVGKTWSATNSVGRRGGANSNRRSGASSIGDESHRGTNEGSKPHN